MTQQKKKPTPPPAAKAAKPQPSAMPNAVVLPLGEYSKLLERYSQITGKSNSELLERLADTLRPSLESALLPVRERVVEYDQAIEDIRQKFASTSELDLASTAAETTDTGRYAAARN